MMKHRRIAGTILYTSRKPGREGERRGIEHFRFTHHTDGKTTLRAHCEIEEPEPTVLRDIIYSLDERGRPMDCHVRLTVGDAFMGSGWFRFDGDEVECESYGPAIGRVSQRLKIDAPLAGMGTHPIVADGYLLSGQDWSEGEFKTLRCLLPSPDHRGASPPMICTVAIGAKFLGRETVTVAAGTFDARHFAFIDEGDSGFAGQHPPYELWITDDADGLFLKGGVDAPMLTWYELTSLER